MASSLVSILQRHDRVFATRIRDGPLSVLLSCKKPTCRRCRYCTHFDTVWATEAGEAHRLTWCQSCFNADCLGMELDEKLRPLWQKTIDQLADPSRLSYWNGARSAVEELERQGLV